MIYYNFFIFLIFGVIDSEIWFADYLIKERDIMINAFLYDLRFFMIFDVFESFLVIFE